MILVVQGYKCASTLFSNFEIFEWIYNRIVWRLFYEREFFALMILKGMPGRYNTFIYTFVYVYIYATLYKYVQCMFIYKIIYLFVYIYYILTL